MYKLINKYCNRTLEIATTRELNQAYTRNSYCEKKIKKKKKKKATASELVYYIYVQFIDPFFFITTILFSKHATEVTEEKESSNFTH
jgi:hypothetical protein